MACSPNATQTFLVTPKTLDDPSVLVDWMPEAETGIERLVVGELHILRIGSKDCLTAFLAVSAADSTQRESQPPQLGECQPEPR